MTDNAVENPNRVLIQASLIVLAHPRGDPIFLLPALSIAIDGMRIDMQMIYFNEVNTAVEMGRNCLEMLFALSAPKPRCATLSSRVNSYNCHFSPR